jgi:hypothetical protein
MLLRKLEGMDCGRQRTETSEAAKLSKGMPPVNAQSIALA